ncbi:MAG: hypothetical protein AB1489_07540 [Acidobacteriota bacterium]
MRSIVGIFRTPDEAQRAAQHLLEQKTPAEQIRILTPETAKELTALVPTEDAEETGVGKVIGAVVGAAIGLAGATHLGSYIWASYQFPGISILVATGIILTCALGLWLGGKIFGGIENVTSTGVPHDDLFLYQDAIAQQRSIVIMLANSEERAALVRETLMLMGAESVNAAQDQWWLGLRNIETEHYQTTSPTPKQKQAA